MKTMSKLVAAAALLGSALLAIEPAAAQKSQGEPTEAQKAECLKKAQAFEAATGHHGVTVRSDCLKAAARSNAAGVEKTGKTLPWSGPRAYGCTRPGSRAFYACDAAEYKAQTDAAARAARMKSEMDAEARAYKKIQDERQRSKPTTEICYMKNGKLECKPQ